MNPFSTRIRTKNRTTTLFSPHLPIPPPSSPLSTQHFLLSTLFPTRNSELGTRNSTQHLPRLPKTDRL
uniref:Uncharacterized protein n=1 Tax=Desertifilum tharense IPPAS B-1220 TaxID=1781255 RepID=A0ACD5GQN3_9CYAN